MNITQTTAGEVSDPAGARGFRMRSSQKSPGHSLPQVLLLGFVFLF